MKKRKNGKKRINSSNEKKPKKRTNGQSNKDSKKVAHQRKRKGIKIQPIKDDEILKIEVQKSQPTFEPTQKVQNEIRLRQQHLEIFDFSDPSEKIRTIKPGDCTQFLRSLKLENKKIQKASIIFHNDADGLFSGILARNLLRRFGYEVSPVDMHPISHLELPGIKYEQDMIYLYVDIQPVNRKENIYCIDHHLYDGKTYEFSENNLIYSPENIEREFPTTSALLVIYLNYVNNHGILSFVDYINEKIWAQDELNRLLVILCAIADNLWLLSKYSEIYKLRDWIKELHMSERKLIKLSMAVSILLGKESDCDRIVKIFSEKPLEFFNEAFLESAVESISVEIDNLYKFARTMGEDSEKFIEASIREVTEEIDRLEGQIQRTRDTIANYRKAMPIGLRNNPRAALEMLETVGDREKPKWKQIEFYGIEIERLENNVESLLNRLEYYKEKKNLISGEKIPGICLFMPKQSSEQVKGIMSSLLYYFGFRNIVIEEFEHYAVWGARGFARDELESELTTLTFDRHTLEVYRSIEDDSKALPKTYQRSLNISQNVTFDYKYIGGMGGRGRVYGGFIKGKVPLLFAFLESPKVEKMMNKLQELIKHGQLSAALKGLTEGESQVPTAQALRSKFKTRNWVTIQVLAGTRSGDILLGDLGMVIAWLSGVSNELSISTTLVEKNR